jgi:hypothetical protein
MEGDDKAFLLLLLRTAETRRRGFGIEPEKPHPRLNAIKPEMLISPPLRLCVSAVILLQEADNGHGVNKRRKITIF